MTTRSYLGALLVMGGAALWSGCTQPECANNDYTRAECRVIVENELARRRTAAGIEIRFQRPAAVADSTWSALGLVSESGGRLTARVATLGDFSLSLANPTNSDATLTLDLTNVHDQAQIAAGRSGHEELISPSGNGTRRRLSLSARAGEVIWVRGTVDCPPVYRVLAVADVQTNPTQFGRIVARIDQEYRDATAAGELLAGVIVAGDLSENATREELTAFSELLEPAAVPFAVIPGNHDVFSGTHPNYSECFGPGNYDFGVCSSHFALFDSGSGTLADSVLGRLPELFARGSAEHSIAVVHHPPYPRLSGAGWSSEADAAVFLGEFALQGGEQVISGHAHRLARFSDVSVGERSIDQLIVGTGGAVQTAKSPLFGYVRLTFRDGIDTCFVEVPPVGAQPTDAQELAVRPCTEP